MLYSNNYNNNSNNDNINLINTISKLKTYSHVYFFLLFLSTLLSTYLIFILYNIYSILNLDIIQKLNFTIINDISELIMDIHNNKLIECLIDKCNSQEPSIFS